MYSPQTFDAVEDSKHAWLECDHYVEFRSRLPLIGNPGLQSLSIPPRAVPVASDSHAYELFV
jgi:hypothetical protein